MSEFINIMIPVVRTAFYTIGVTFLISVTPVLFLAVPSLSFFKQKTITTTTTTIYFLTVLEARSPRTRCWQVWFLLRPLS